MKTPTKAIDTQGLRRALTTLSFAGALAGWAVLARPEVPAMATATTPEVAEVVDAPVETSVEAPVKVLAALVNVSAAATVQPTAAPVATAKPTAAPAAPAKPAAAPAAPRVVAAPAPRRVVAAPAPRVVAAPASVTRTRSSRR